MGEGPTNVSPGNALLCNCNIIVLMALIRVGTIVDRQLVYLHFSAGKEARGFSRAFYGKRAARYGRVHRPSSITGQISADACRFACRFIEYAGKAPVIIRLKKKRRRNFRQRN